MKTSILAAVLLSVGAAAMSCGDKQATSDLSWGHLQDQSLNPNAPQYLINKKPGDIYRVCVPRYMVDELPGVESEVKAAINVWAAYLGRSIQVETSVRDLPRATAIDTPNSLQAAYYTSCGDEFDVVIGFAPLRGSTVGQTGSSWRGFSAQKITSFKRYLFLRDYKASPDSWGTNRWISLQDLKTRAFDSSELVNQMQARNTIEVAPRGTSMALPVLVHEFGHVWGMCDQYEGPSNCDPNFKSEHPDLNSMMAAASNIARLYLADDDITGIRALAQRPGFNASWPGTDEALNQEPTPILQKEVEYFQLKSVEKAGNQYSLNFGIMTSKGGELRVEYRMKGAASWQQSTTFFPSDEAFRIADYTFRQTVRTDGDYEFRLKLRLKNDDKTFGEAIYAAL